MIEFEKYHGTGNDFIIIDNRHAALTLSTGQIAALCNRRFGIGADGLMILTEREGYDFSMTYYNSDGKESTLCGNGGRCMTAFARSLGLVHGQARFLAIDGEHVCRIGETPDGVVYTLKMRDTRIARVENDGIFLDTGSPHFVRFVSDARKSDVVGEGRLLRFDTRFSPGGCNIDFVSPVEGGLFVRTYERGVEEETLSCGTGVTAAALAEAFRTNQDPGHVHVETPGGFLSVSFTRSQDRFTNIWLEGPAVFVFRGRVDVLMC